MSDKVTLNTIIQQCDTCQVKRTYATSNVRIKDNAPQRHDEIQSLSRQLTRLTEQLWVPHFTGTNVGLSIDGSMLRGVWTEDQMVDYLRTEVHKAINVSNNALLVYGIDLGEDGEVNFPEAFDGELDDFLFQYHTGTMKPEYPDEVSEVRDYDKRKQHPLFKEWEKKYDEYLAQKKEWCEGHPVSQLERIYYCSYDYPMYLLGIKKMSVSRGYLGELTADTLAVEPWWDAAIKETCDILGIEYTQPKWYITTMNG